MALQIIKGKKRGPARAIIYGVEGIGKSSLAAQIPGSLFLDTEDGTGEIDVNRVTALDWRSIEYAVKDLIADQQGFTALVIDTADWLERALIDHMLKQAGKKSIEDYGYGKGYTRLQEHVSRFLSLIDQLSAKGVHVVFVAHAKTVRTSPPDQTDGFDRYELKLTKQVAPLLKEWADVILFVNYKIQIVEGSDGRLKAQGGKDRVMYATHSAAWDAKNRFGLPDEILWGTSPAEAFAQIAHIFGSVGPATSAPVVAAPTAKEAAPTKPAATPPVLATADQLKRLAVLSTSAVGGPMIDLVLEANEAVGVDELETSAAENLICEIEAKLAEIAKASAVATPGKIAAWLDANAEAVNAYLVRVAWVTTGQTWRDLSEARMKSLIEKSEKFARAAGIPALA